MTLRAGTGELAALLEYDEAYAKCAREWMDRLDPSLYNAFDEAALLYRLVSNAFVNLAEAHEHEQDIFRATLDLNISWSELTGRILRGDPDPLIARARERATALIQLRTARHRVSSAVARFPVGRN